MSCMLTGNFNSMTLSCMLTWHCIDREGVREIGRGVGLEEEGRGWIGRGGER